MIEGKQEPTPGSPTPAPCCMWPAGNAGAHGHGAVHPLGPGPGKADRDPVGTGEAAVSVLPCGNEGLGRLASPTWEPWG